MMSDRYKHARRGKPIRMKHIRVERYDVPGNIATTHDVEPMAGPPIMMKTRGWLMQALNTHSLFVVKTVPRLR